MKDLTPYEKKLKKFSRKLRSHSTEEEIILWSRIRKKQINGHAFYRQKPIGNYIADFYCPSLKLILEIDGSQHVGSEKDAVRDAYFKEIGLRIYRIPNREIRINIKNVIDTIWAIALKDSKNK